MNQINQKIIEAIIKKAKAICPKSLALIAVYGSVATGDVYEKSDLDLMILINDDEGWKLAEGFILDDVAIGYDLYCTNWEMLERDAQCNHARLSKLMDCKIVDIEDDNAVVRLDSLKEKVTRFLGSDDRFVRVEEILKNAKVEYADAMMKDNLSLIRTKAASVINLLLDAVMLWNGGYFKKGVKRTFEELREVATPEGFIDDIKKIAQSDSVMEIRGILTELMVRSEEFLLHTNIKAEPSKDNITGTYEEMYSNWRNKMQEAADHKDVFSSFMNLASLQLMLDEIAGEVEIKKYSVMDRYNPLRLEDNVKLYDTVLKEYLAEYKKADIKPKHFTNIDEFVEYYSLKGTL